jgi:proline iminopeptidase
MKKNLSRLIKLILLLVLLAGGYIIFLPHTYDVPALAERKGTQYWDLTTGSRIAYTLLPAKGEKKLIPVIFLQGGPGGPIYDQNIKSLTPLSDAGYDVYLYDQVGCGYSGRLKNIEEYTVGRHVKDLEAIVKLLGIAKVILIGQSWGAMLASEYIANNSNKVEKVIFTGPGYILPRDRSLENIAPPDSLHLKQPQFTNQQGREKVYNYRARVVEYCAKAFDWKMASDKEMDEFETLLDHEMGKSTLCDPSRIDVVEGRSGFYSMVKTVQSFNDVEDIRPKLKDCKIPALIMRGQCDGMKWGYVTEYIKLFTNHKLVIIPDAGHSIAREQPGLYIKNILEFLGQ